MSPKNRFFASYTNSETTSNNGYWDTEQLRFFTRNPLPAQQPRRMCDRRRDGVDDLYQRRRILRISVGDFQRSMAFTSRHESCFRAV